MDLKISYLISLVVLQELTWYSHHLSLIEHHNFLFIDGLVIFTGKHSLASLPKLVFITPNLSMWIKINKCVKFVSYF